MAEGEVDHDSRTSVQRGNPRNRPNYTRNDPTGKGMVGKTMIDTAILAMMTILAFALLVIACINLAGMS